MVATTIFVWEWISEKSCTSLLATGKGTKTRQRDRSPAQMNECDTTLDFIPLHLFSFSFLLL